MSTLTFVGLLVACVLGPATPLLIFGVAKGWCAITRRWLEAQRAAAPSQAPAKITCTYCGGTRFLEGPAGGICVNVQCAEPLCRHRFNIAPLLAHVEDLHAQGPQ